MRAGETEESKEKCLRVYHFRVRNSAGKFGVLICV